MPYVKLQPDPAAVQRLIAGDRVSARMPDYREAVRVLAERKLTDGQIAHLLRRSRRSIERTRNALGIPPALPRWRGTTPIVHGIPTRPRDMR